VSARRVIKAASAARRAYDVAEGSLGSVPTTWMRAEQTDGAQMVGLVRQLDLRHGPMRNCMYYALRLKWGVGA
jgi:hypothetical protein